MYNSTSTATRQPLQPQVSTAGPAQGWEYEYRSAMRPARPVWRAGQPFGSIGAFGLPRACWRPVTGGRRIRREYDGGCTGRRR